MKNLRSLIILVALSVMPISWGMAQSPEESFLLHAKSANFEEGIEAFEALPPTENKEKFLLGMLYFLDASEGLVQSFYEHGSGVTGSGTRMVGGQLPFFRLRLPPNPDVQPINHEQFRQIFLTFMEGMDKCQQVLATLDEGEFTAAVPLGEVNFDVAGNGVEGEFLSAATLFGTLNRQAIWDKEANATLVVNFDRGDADWFLGYSHLLSSFAGLIAGYDTEKLFENTAHMVFPLPETEVSTYLYPYRGGESSMFWDEIADVIALIHLINLPVKDAEMIAEVRLDLKQVIATSRSSWGHWMAETDNQNEWIPNPNQECVFAGWTMTEEQQVAWLAFLDELDAVLDGTKLVPYWRGNTGKGVNIRRAFEEPKALDLLLWIQGSAPIPYLEEGELTAPDFWRSLNRQFSGQFFGFAAWLN